eukprot:UN04510
MKSYIVFSLAILAIWLIITQATTISTLAQQFQIQQKPDEFTAVTITRIGDETMTWVDSDYNSSRTAPLLVYGDEMEITWAWPSSVESGMTSISFVWCEKDETDKSCDTSTEVRVAVVETIAGKATFKIPTLSFSKFFESFVRFKLLHEFGTTLYRYESKYTYHSDIASKTTKNVATAIIVFCVVMILIGLAILGYLVFKKVKKMRRERHGLHGGYTWRH